MLALILLLIVVGLVLPVLPLDGQVRNIIIVVIVIAVILFLFGGYLGWGGLHRGL